jgi:hypothetical protein
MLTQLPNFCRSHMWLNRPSAQPPEDTLESRKLEARLYYFLCSSQRPSRPLLSIFFETGFILRLDYLNNFKMRPLAFATAVLSFATTALCADKSNFTQPLTSRTILPKNFKPPQTFKNVNLVHIINLEKGHVKESINVVIENIANSPQDEYFLPFTSRQMETIGSLEVKDKKDPDSGFFNVQAVDFDTKRYE